STIGTFELLTTSHAPDHSRPPISPDSQTCQQTLDISLAGARGALYPVVIFRGFYYCIVSMLLSPLCGRDYDSQLAHQSSNASNHPTPSAHSSHSSTPPEEYCAGFSPH